MFLNAWDESYTKKQDAMAHEQNVPTETDPKGTTAYEVSDK